MDNSFDFLCDAILHVSEVGENLETVASEIRKRGFAHDRTKFQDPEFSAFITTRDKFKKVNYGTPEYQAVVDEIKPAVEHHYKNNRHHTNYHPNGINDMTLVDIIEMVADWRAAARRSPDKTFEETLPYAFEKYGVGEQLGKIITNTIHSLGWAKD